MKGQMLKPFVVATVCLSIVAGCVAPPALAPTPLPPTATPIPPTPVPPSPTPDPLAIAKAYQDAIARHDVDAAMALFTDDATYGWGDYFTTSDKTMIRNWLEYAAGLNSQTKANDCKPNGPTVTCKWRFVHDCFGAEGAIGAGYDMGGTVVFTVKDGRISEYVLTWSPDPEYDQWEEDFFKWLEDSYPMDIGSVVQALRTWKFDRDFGQRLGKFCKEQAESLKATPAATSAFAAPVQAWVDVMNSGDVDATLALFTDDVKYSVFEYYATGKDQLRGIFDWLAGLETKYQITECQPKGDRAVCTMPVVDACIAGSGATDGLPTKQTFVFQPDGKISQVSGYLEGSEWDNYFSKWVYPGTSWMKANRAEESAKVDATANRREAGAIQAKLCKEYGASLKAAPTATPMPPTPASSSDLEKLAMAFQDAFNQGDFNGVLALFVDEGLSYFDGGFTARDKETLRREVLEYNSGLGGTVEFIDCAPKGEALRCTALWRNAHCLKAGCGLDVWHSELTVKPKDGKIQLMSFQDGSVTAEDQKACDQAYPKYEAWATANRPEEWKKLNVPVAFDLKGRPLGELASRVCKDYLDSQK